MPKATQPNHPAGAAHKAHQERLVTWLQAEQGWCLLNIERCRIKEDDEELIYWARRHAQLSIAETVAGWFESHSTI